jgi:hypothetical protein
VNSAALVFVALLVAMPACAQEKAVAMDGVSAGQQADYRKLMRGYLDTFRVLGRSKLCGLNFESDSYFREVARRHGEGSEPFRVAGLAFTAAAENLVLPFDVEPTPPAPMPCDVVALMRGGIELPALPASLARHPE